MKHMLLCAALVISFGASSVGAAGAEAFTLAEVDSQSSRVHLEVSQVDNQPALAVVFVGTDDLHYYARSETAAAPAVQSPRKVESAWGRVSARFFSAAK